MAGEVERAADEDAQRTGLDLLQAGDGGLDVGSGIGGPRESEAPGIYARARSLIAAMLDRVT